MISNATPNPRTPADSAAIAAAARREIAPSAVTILGTITVKCCGHE